ncbi:hypothetical protein N0V93_000361 [Gnomoniopsis smithogilvyi]|uniref:Uncharacterized protein n=1 Tax=Gnomoniopsis smithogilvyi TaxID=1191159 RepID=A0A9W8Z1S2_9PEZI|nr:hypothetical protein N0V93_000361 [Gnomoniopsis smithogilvyi]
MNDLSLSVWYLESIISCCTVTDGDAVAAKNLPGFWADPHFRQNWPTSPLEYYMIRITKRFLNNSLTGREIERHLKAVHPDTSRIVGYVRWNWSGECYASSSNGKRTADSSSFWYAWNEPYACQSYCSYRSLMAGSTWTS